MIQGSFTLGPVTVPYTLVLIIASALAAHILVRLIHGKDRMKEASDRLFLLILVYMGAWRLSLVLTHREALSESLTSLLVLPGGRINHILASVVVLFTLAILFYRRKMDRPQALSLSMLCAAILLFSLILYVPARRLVPELTAPESFSQIRITTPEGKEEDLVMDGAEATVINFWASWCPPCRAELPELRQWWQEYGNGKIRFYALNMTSTEKSRDELRQFIKEEARELPVYLDDSGRAAAEFFITALPTTMVFNREGELISYRTGAVDRPWLEKAVEEAIKK